MKMDQDHVVPLSEPALTILEEMRDGNQGDLIFPNPDGGVFSENAMLKVLDRLGYGHVTVHGFRSTFATWAEECTDYPDGRAGSSASAQIQVGDHGRLSARSETRKAAGPDERLGRDAR
jgi:integrase